jgi:hypothetical protein
VTGRGSRSNENFHAILSIGCGFPEAGEFVCKPPGPHRNASIDPAAQGTT